MLILKLKESLWDQAHIFQEAHFESFQIRLITIMYHSKYANHDILLNFLFQNLYKLFLHARNPLE